MSKIKCPNPDHDDQTPSFHLYEDGGYCFVCGWTEKGEYEVKKKEPEDIKKTIAYIETLPIMYIRELWLHAEGNDFYIVWPDGSYYKKRTHNGRVRYIGPVGHKAPLFIMDKQKGPTLIIEGEINALSFKSASPNFKGTVVSPGSCNEFMRHLDTILTIVDKTAIVIVDRDPAGVTAGIELKRELLKRGKKVILVALETDFNDLLQHGGKEAVREVFERETGLEVS